jgi:hypothetical protein
MSVAASCGPSWNFSPFEGSTTETGEIVSSISVECADDARAITIAAVARSLFTIFLSCLIRVSHAKSPTEAGLHFSPTRGGRFSVAGDRFLRSPRATERPPRHAGAVAAGKSR